MIFLQRKKKETRSRDVSGESVQQRGRALGRKSGAAAEAFPAWNT